MPFVSSLILRFAVAAAVCALLAATAIVTEAARSVSLETRAAASLAGRQIEAALLRSGSGYGSEATFAAVEALPSDALGTGRCFTYRSAEDGWTLCRGSDATEAVAPTWYPRLLQIVGMSGTPVEIAVNGPRGRAGQLSVRTEPTAVAVRTWSEVRIIAGVAGTAALATSVLLIGLVGHALLPTRRTLAGLRRLEAGDYAARLPQSGVREFDTIADAFNGLAERLEQITAERAALTRRLIAVQEEERRTLARELHDEFGQSLTAIQSLAAAVELGAEPHQTASIEDARLIGRVAARLSEIVRGSLERLRPSELDTYGLAASLRGLLLGRDGVLTRRDGKRVEVDLSIDETVEEASPEIALSFFRVVQECLTNTARHGQSKHIRIQLLRETAQQQAGYALLIEDDGGGSDDRAGSGLGLSGMRERIMALGGRFSVERSAHGMRLSASVPSGAGGPA
ncbi:histidine kinase [Chthonobacter albigriseus]|uniref:histidine kinase n=1 Tax=Chthonobacter albigriseus TaxID=1683161 RepID=UPI0015EFD643|nr:histidine kinase [Chthonobacter albigriseus]